MYDVMYIAQGYSLKSTEMCKKEGRYIYILVYLRNGNVTSSLNLILISLKQNLNRLVADSYFNKCCKTVRYILGNILPCIFFSDIKT